MPPPDDRVAGRTGRWTCPTTPVSGCRSPSPTPATTRCRGWVSSWTAPAFWSAVSRPPAPRSNRTSAAGTCPVHHPARRLTRTTGSGRRPRCRRAPQSAPTTPSSRASAPRGCARSRCAPTSSGGRWRNARLRGHGKMRAAGPRPRRIFRLVGCQSHHTVGRCVRPDGAPDGSSDRSAARATRPSEDAGGRAAPQTDLPTCRLPEPPHRRKMRAGQQAGLRRRDLPVRPGRRPRTRRTRRGSWRWVRPSRRRRPASSGRRRC